MFRLDHKTAVVTGGGSGIGKAIAGTFASAGAHVIILDFNEAAANETVATIAAAGGSAAARACDVSNHRQVEVCIDALAAHHRHLHILVNAAGVAHVGNLEKTTEQDLDRLYNVNVKGVYNLMHAIIGHMREQGGGCILNVASVAATVGIPDRFAYSMTKGAVLTMTLSVARDYLAEKIRCNSVSPARVHTPFVDGFLKANYPGRETEMFEKLSRTQPIGRMGTPDEVAALALYLCSDEAGFVTGCDYPIDGGFIKLNN